MEAELWVPADKQREARDHSGPLPVGFNLEVGAGWGRDALRNLPPCSLLDKLTTETGPDWIPSAKRSERPEWESERLNHGKAEIVRWFWPLLYSGRMRAFGYRALPDAPYEWIPRQEWVDLKSIDQGNAWSMLFRNTNAFRLNDGAPAWCDVRVVLCERANPSILSAERQGIATTDSPRPDYIYRRVREETGPSEIANPKTLGVSSDDAGNIAKSDISGATVPIPTPKAGEDPTFKPARGRPPFDGWDQFESEFVRTKDTPEMWQNLETGAAYKSHRQYMIAVAARVVKLSGGRKGRGPAITTLNGRIARLEQKYGK